MIYLIFKNNRCSGYATLPYNSKTENEIVKQVSESELNGLIPDSFDAENWKDVRRHYKLEDGELVFDESYEPETENEDEGV